MNKTTGLARKRQLIDNKGRILGKYDLFVPLFIALSVVLLFFVAKVLLQKDTYITVDLFASGGEWWWNNPDPPQWLTDPIQPGAKELDSLGKVLVEVVKTNKFEVGDRKMLWMRARLRVTAIKSSGQYRFRREPIQVGSVIYVAPNNVKINSSVMWIEGVDEERQESEKLITIKNYGIYPWLADAVNVGDKMKTDDGQTMAEILEKQVEPAEVPPVALEDGVLYVGPNSRRKDMTLKLRIKTAVSKGRHYFSYFQPVKVGFYIMFPFESANVSGYITRVE
ncbi:hypothetical protein KKB64_00070 [Patescibacteria group bacterium]|nr:hypothetical protein [Patescibacteria group bacterium]MBU1472170.1 hypothetical protein [Patescibacteria group bacterium]MBU2459564.1 hypothetical protein [Patescibacteria group bacterium]MBU2544195.1 hypothetical protein [Patescibacteria group bacterium]